MEENFCEEEDYKDWLIIISFVCVRFKCGFNCAFIAPNIKGWTNKKKNDEKKLTSLQIKLHSKNQNTYEIGHLICEKIEYPELEECSELNEADTERGAGGFGSTGTNWY